ncbi:hypothetical protein H6762_05000 [Candidatus Nomurabacteria bacterium]|nr:hypothetical protein [Candidatus Nomurabacteria bacterium]
MIKELSLGILYILKQEEILYQYPPREKIIQFQLTELFIMPLTIYTLNLKCEGSPLDCHMRLVFGELLSERDLDFDFEGSTYNLLQKMDISVNKQT